MVYFCADDYGLNEISSAHIQQCIDAGTLNKVGVFPNFEQIDFAGIKKDKDIRITLHINLVEGRCLSDPSQIDLLADENGNLKHTFCGLLKLNIFQRKKFEQQVYKEIKAQVSYWKSILPQDLPFCVDTHQHVSMIPGVFRGMLATFREAHIEPRHIRIPIEPLSPYLTTPSLYFTYNPVNIVKQWLLNFLWLINKSQLKNYKINASYFLGILFSGEMDKKRLDIILPKYEKLAQKNGKDIEVLFHPGYLEEDDPDFHKKNVVFKSFYLSKKRRAEYDSLMNYRKK